MIKSVSVVNKRGLFSLLCFIILFVGFNNNLWKAAYSESFALFDEYSECLAVGKIARSDKEGVFSHGGLPGINYDAAVVPPNSDIWAVVYLDQRPDYISDNVPESYEVYRSQTGGQLILYSIIQKVLPFENGTRLSVFYTINALLSALCFTLFLGWVFRNFGLLSALVSLVFIIMSSWLTLFGHSLWWTLWGSYIPFITMLLVLEYNHKVKKISENKILLYLFFAVFAKCLFNGYEFISTLLVCAICPIVFYAWVEKQKLKSFLTFFVKASVACIMAVLVQIMVLLIQIRSVTGTFASAIDYIVTSYTRRSFSADGMDDYSYLYLFKRYLKGNAFRSDFMEEHSIVIYFGYLILAVVVCAAVVYFLSRGLDEVRKRFNMALLITTATSLLAPLSWLIVFKQHSLNHFHLDYIIWYMPFLLLGFVIIGKSISLVVGKLVPHS